MSFFQTKQLNRIVGKKIIHKRITRCSKLHSSIYRSLTTSCVVFNTKQILGLHFFQFFYFVKYLVLGTHTVLILGNRYSINKIDLGTPLIRGKANPVMAPIQFGYRLWSLLSNE